MGRLTKKFWSLLLTAVMTLTLLPAVAVNADSTTSLKFSAGDLTHASVTYQIDGGEVVTVNAATADDGGAIIVNGVTGSEAKIQVTNVDQGYRLNVIRVNEGENTAVFNGQYNNETRTFTFPLRAEMVSTYSIVIDVSEESGAPGSDDVDTSLYDMSADFTVKIGGVVIFDNAKPEGSKITVPAEANYTVSIYEGTVRIEPIKGTGVKRTEESDKLGSFKLSSISTTGKGTVRVDGGLNYEVDGEDGHVEEEFSMEIGKNSAGYSFNGNGTANLILTGKEIALAGAIYASDFNCSDCDKLVIGNAAAPVNNPFQSADKRENRGIEFYNAEVTIYAIGTVFDNYLYVRAADEAKITVNAGTFDTVFFKDVDYLRVQTGGTFTLKGKETVSLPETMVIQSGWYVQEGQILELSGQDRVQDMVKYTNCVEGDFAAVEGRYTYTKLDEGKTIELASTCRTMWSLGYSFVKVNNEAYVEHGDFAISAGSGLKGEHNKNGGEYWFEQGTQVTFKLLPDTGYKYKDGTFLFNGSNSEEILTPTEEPGTYIFTMPANPIHVSCTFEKGTSTVDVSEADDIKGASIKLAKDSINGVAELDVEDTKLSKKEAAKFQEVADDLTIGTTVDITINEVIDKIGTDEEWKTEVTETSDKTTVTLKLDESLAYNSEYTVIREHNGVVEEIAATYNSSNNTITFKSGKFSTYAIAYKPATPAKKGTVIKDTAGNQYKVTSSKVSNPTVAFYRPAKGTKATGTIKIASSVKIKNVTYKVTSVSDQAFKGCTKITEVALGANITTVGKEAFNGCSKLKTFTTNTKLKTIGDSAFKGCKKLTTLTVKTDLLTKSSVKNSLKNSYVTKVKLTTKAAQKKLSKYNSYFAKANSGKKITVTK